MGDSPRSLSQARRRQRRAHPSGFRVPPRHCGVFVRCRRWPARRRRISWSPGCRPSSLSRQPKWPTVAEASSPAAWPHTVTDHGHPGTRGQPGPLSAQTNRRRTSRHTAGSVPPGITAYFRRFEGWPSDARWLCPMVGQIGPCHPVGAVDPGAVGAAESSTTRTSRVGTAARDDGSRVIVVEHDGKGPPRDKR